MDAGGPRLLDEERLCQAAEYEAGRHCLTVTFRKYLKDLFVKVACAVQACIGRA